MREGGGREREKKERDRKRRQREGEESRIGREGEGRALVCMEGTNKMTEQIKELMKEKKSRRLGCKKGWCCLRITKNIILTALSNMSSKVLRGCSKDHQLLCASSLRRTPWGASVPLVAQIRMPRC